MDFLNEGYKFRQDWWRSRQDWWRSWQDWWRSRQDWWRSFGRTGGAVCKGATPLPELFEGLILSWAANPHLSSGLVTALRAFMMLTCCVLDNRHEFGHQVKSF